AAEAGMDRQVAEVRDPGAAVRELEAERPGGPPLPVVLDLDHEAPELAGLALRPVDLLQHRGTIAWSHRGQIGLDVLVGRQLEQEVDVGRLRTPKSEAVAPNSQGAGVAGAAARRGRRTAPDPSATPPRISTIPASSSPVTASPTNTAPYNTAATASTY